MDSMPLALTTPLQAAGRDVASAWWAGLSSASREEVTALCDPGQDRFFGPADAGAPQVVGGRFVPHDDAWGFAEWGPGWFDHLMEHPEVMLADVIVVRTFHICTRHPAARAAAAAGHLPADFVCPLESTGCPMRRLLDAVPGRSLQLAGAGSRVVALPVIPSPSSSGSP
jgi:hypothetical protein